MGNSSHKASAQAAVATSMAGQSNLTSAAIAAQYGPVSGMAIHTCKKIGIAYPKK